MWAGLHFNRRRAGNALKAALAFLLVLAGLLALGFAAPLMRWLDP